MRRPKTISYQLFSEIFGRRWIQFTYPHSPITINDAEGESANRVPIDSETKTRDKGKGKARQEPEPPLPADYSQNSLVVDLLFLCNLPELEKDADALFTAFQMELDMVYEPGPSKPLSES